MNALLTDLYQLTMAAGYFVAGKTAERATFELFLRRLPWRRNFIVAAGLEQAVEYLLGLRFEESEIAWLRGLPQFTAVPDAFFDSLRALRFTGDVFAVREGTPVFAGEPILTVRAPLMEAQIPETFLLATIGFQSMIATKAARIIEAAGTASVVEFGTRRAHSPQAGTLAARAAYIGGCTGTSNVLAGMRYGIPVFGTAAHSWVQSFESEVEAFSRLQSLLGESTVQLVDTYDTLKGARRAATLGRPLWGVRIDSGNLAELSRGVREILNGSGLRDVKIMASGDLNEYKILELTATGAPIDSYGVGTDLTTSSDYPNLGVIYKLVELESEGRPRYTAKFSEDKQTLPGAKQVFRFPGHDQIACHWECPSENAEALLAPVIINGQLVEPLSTAGEARRHAAESIRRLPGACRSLAFDESGWRVEHSSALLELLQKVRSETAGTT